MLKTTARCFFLGVDSFAAWLMIITTRGYYQATFVLLRQLNRTRDLAEVLLWQVPAIEEIRLCLGISNYRICTPAFNCNARPGFRGESVTFNPDCITKTLGRGSVSIVLEYTWMRSGRVTNLHDSYRAASGFVKWK